MKKVFFVVLVALFSGNLFAADDYGVVDIQKINQEAAVYKNLQSQIQQKQNSFQIKISNADAEIKSEEKKLSDSRDTLSPQEFERRRKALVAKFESEQKNMQTERQAINESISGAALEVGKKLEEAIAEVAKNKNLSIVYVKNSLAYYSQDKDVTKEVISALNKKISRVQLK